MYCMYCVNSYSNMCVSVHVCACACACACVHRHTHTHVHNTQSFEASVGTPVAVCVYKHAHATSVQPNIAHMHSTHAYGNRSSYQYSHTKPNPKLNPELTLNGNRCSYLCTTSTASSWRRRAGRRASRR